jgi:hypothetical protein
MLFTAFILALAGTPKVNNVVHKDLVTIPIQLGREYGTNRSFIVLSRGR